MAAQRAISRTSISQQIQAMIQLDENELAHFLGQLQPLKVKRREMLLQEGEVCRYAFFVVKGCIRYFQVVDGDEHTGQFFFENSWYADYASFITQRPSAQHIQALEKCELLLLPKARLDELYKDIPKFERFGRLMAENAFLGLRQRTQMLASQSAEERYLELVEKRPKVIARVPQHYIASYLGIKPPSLSRIRKRIG